MKKFFLWIFIILLCSLISSDIYYGLSYGILLILLKEIIFESNNKFVFREWALLLYALNYLVAPAITYQLPDDKILYGMKIPSDEYFTLAIPGYFFLMLGMFIIPVNNIFRVNFKKVNQAAVLNKNLLKKITVLGVFMKLIYSFMPGETAFFVYLLGLVRFVGAFALLTINNKYWYWSAVVLLLELASAFLAGMFHDAIMWVIFFGLFYVYSIKPSFRTKITGVISAGMLVLFVQAIKFAYREEVWEGNKEASLTTVAEVGSRKASSDELIGEENLLSTLNRGNQAWIFASTVANMDQSKNFQGLTNVNKYFEAALLPRFLAPDKIKSGDKEIFNEFSGHVINEGTSMGLGIFADGYIAYGSWGVYLFGFTLGLIFSLSIKLVERWTRVSPFYVLLLMPLLNYAVRPDCELQTTINHLFKGILLYGFLVYLTRKRFTLDSHENQRKLLHLNLATNKK